MYIYGDRRDFGRIDVYVAGKYRFTTSAATTLSEAKEKFLKAHPEEACELVETAYSDNDSDKNAERRQRLRIII
jgi:hypothetical protein